MPTPLKLLSASVALAAVLAGCAPKYSQVATQPAAMSPAEKNFDAVWQASRQVLQDYYFALDRQDRRAGVITTTPLVGKQGFEVWRKDAVRSPEEAESSFQTIYRTAKVTIRPVKENAATYQAEVEVTLRRSDKPRQEITSTADAYQLFSAGRGRKPRPEPLLTSGIDARTMEHTTDLGNDRALEARLTADIANQAAKLGAR